ncbi:MAG: hypothetical protein M0Z79_13720 [Nitrospiraceae bacterium]|nr:hypothetical protein [Nitrospiraceae bacterium]
MENQVLEQSPLRGLLSAALGQIELEVVMNRKRIEQLQDINEADKIRLLLEHEEMAAGRIRAWSTAVSIFIPLLIAALTIVYNVHLQAQRAKIDFELKAAEIVMSAESPTAAHNKATVLVELFPERLSPRFRETFENMYGHESR